ncbi:hypothetical protein Y032_0102g3486 [Ancylostoma ceylanicum]|uniref:Uncharacterized protein n=1 Tax=Ancylostoma ceylanicum TaxID=53326 RepID=A0A016TGN9_9BILA|nr:hypothetical protein Y032_0102g3486 [Ancylostoma ceylanicum]
MASAMKANVITVPSAVPHLGKPFASMGEHKKPRKDGVHLVTAMNLFFEKLHQHLDAHVMPVFVIREEHDRPQLSVQRKEKAAGRGPLYASSCGRSKSGPETWIVANNGSAADMEKDVSFSEEADIEDLLTDEDVSSKKEGMRLTSNLYSN